MHQHVFVCRRHSEVVGPKLF